MLKNWKKKMQAKQSLKFNKAGIPRVFVWLSALFEQLKDYGQCAMVSVRSDINISGYFKYYEETGKGTVMDKEFIHYKVYKGSSEMDSKEMSILIDGAVQEAEQLGIETLPPAELRSLIERWGKDEKHNAE